MKAIVMHAFGGPEVLQSADIPRPAPKAGEILIKVWAAGINPVDCKIRAGSFARSQTLLPAVPGRDVSGTVEGIGLGVRGYNVGDEVYAFLATHAGGYARFAVARENELALKPRTLDHEHAAAVPLAATTAWQALFDHGHLKADQRVLIHGAAGGVGHFAIQFAKTRDATVIATATTDDLALVSHLGADEAIDYEKEDFSEVTEDIDLVVDLIGGDTQKRSWKVLKDGGTIVSTLEQPSQKEAARHRATAKVFRAEPIHEQLVVIGRLIDEGKVRVVLQGSYVLDEAARAQDELERQHSIGKRVLTVV